MKCELTEEDVRRKILEARRKYSKIQKDDLESKKKYEEAQKKYHGEDQKLQKEIGFLEREIDHYLSEIDRVMYVSNNSEKILTDLRKEFKESATLDKKDMSFLFFAIGLQCCRWLLQPKLNLNFEKISRDDRHDSAKDGNREFQRSKEFVEENKSEVIKSRKYPDKLRIFEIAVPYDAMIGTEKIEIPGVTELGKNISGVNHHAATMGHDPILGYIFGTMNILTRTITFKMPTLDTYQVHLHRGSNKNQYVGSPIGFPETMRRTCETLNEDITRLPAAIARQALHMQSDKYTKQGLPIPFISAEKAQILLKQGWNSNEMERFSKLIAKNTATIGIQVLLSILINVVIEILYTLTYDGNDEICEAKCKKILMYSNVIASSSNIIYTAISRDINRLDIGGILVTIHRIVTDSKFIKQIEDEFVYGGFKKQLEIREFTI